MFFNLFRYLVVSLIGLAIIAFVINVITGEFSFAPNDIPQYHPCEKGTIIVDVPANMEEEFTKRCPNWKPVMCREDWERDCQQ